MTLFRNTVILRGFLGSDAEVPDADILTHDSFAVLALCVGSGTWKKATNEWMPRTEWLWIVCSGPWFCGFTRDMKKGEYVEVEGELRGAKSGRDLYVVCATQVRKLDCPPFGVDEGSGG